MSSSGGMKSASAAKNSKALDLDDLLIIGRRYRVLIALIMSLSMLIFATASLILP